MTETESHITEWNSKFVNPQTDDHDLRKGKKGAAILSAAWIALQQEQVDVSTFYRGNDADINADFFFGIHDAHGNPKPIATAFSLWKEMVNYTQQIDISSDNNASKLWLLAGTNSQGKQGILIANPEESDINYSLQGIDNPPISISQLSEDGKQLESISYQENMTIPAQNVQFLTITSSTTAQGGSDQFSATATIKQNQLTLTGHIHPPTEDLGREVNLYAAAIYNQQFYLLTKEGNWNLWDNTPNTLLPFSRITLAQQNNIALVEGLNIQQLTRIPIYLGYGVSSSEVLSGKYGLIYTIEE